MNHNDHLERELQQVIDEQKKEISKMEVKKRMDSEKSKKYWEAVDRILISKNTQKKIYIGDPWIDNRYDLSVSLIEEVKKGRWEMNRCFGCGTLAAITIDNLCRDCYEEQDFCRRDGCDGRKCRCGGELKDVSLISELKQCEKCGAKCSKH